MRSKQVRPKRKGRNCIMLHTCYTQQRHGAFFRGSQQNRSTHTNFICEYHRLKLNCKIKQT